jgi:hypothetical protein
MESIFYFYIPLMKVMAPEKGSHISIYKRISVSLYGFVLSPHLVGRTR